MPLACPVWRLAKRFLQSGMRAVRRAVEQNTPAACAPPKKIKILMAICLKPATKTLMSETTKFYVFADDHQTYGPASSELLQQWAREGLLSLQSWIYNASSETWLRAEKIPILEKLLIPPSSTQIRSDSVNLSGVRVGQLRRIRLLTEMTDQQMQKFIELLEKVKVRAFSPIVKQGEHGDAMFLILDGEARVSVRAEGKEDIIATLGVGDFFGEIALFDEGPRSADVFANKDCTLLRLSKKNVETIVSDHPELAARFMIAMNRFLGDRIRATNERFTRAQNFARGASGQITSPSSMKLVKGY